MCQQAKSRIIVRQLECQTLLRQCFSQGLLIQRVKVLTYSTSTQRRIAPVDVFISRNATLPIGIRFDDASLHGKSRIFAGARRPLSTAHPGLNKKVSDTLSGSRWREAAQIVRHRAATPRSAIRQGKDSGVLLTITPLRRVKGDLDQTTSSRFSYLLIPGAAYKTRRLFRRRFRGS